MKNRNIILTLGALACLGLIPMARAVVPPPDGGYPGFNTAEGQNALFSSTTGVANTGVGWYSLWSNTGSSYNTAVGAGTLLFNTADNNTAFGAAALLFNITGTLNTAAGAVALLHNTDGFANTAIGFQALSSNTEGANNTANGVLALFNNTTGGTNMASGGLALYNNTTGFGNTALGYFAGVDITGDGNVCIGQGVEGEAGVDDSTYIRNVNTLTQNFSAGVNDYVTVRLSDGRLGHTAVVSSQRYKQDIKPLAAMSKALYALKPVSFRLKKEFDPTQALGFGLIAEEVEKVDPALVYRNDKGQVESVRYEMVNAMLLNEFLKEHSAIEQLRSDAARREATISELRKDFGVLRTQLKEQAAQIQRVEAHIETGRPTTRVAVENPSS
jgi:Chaperone of endosialidase